MSKVCRIFACLFLLFLCLSGYTQNDILAFESYNKGVAFLKVDELDSAVFYLEKAVSLKEDLTKSYYNLAVAYYVKGDFNAAVKNIDVFLQTNDEGVNYFLKGRAFDNLQETDSALYCYKLAVEKNPDADGAYFYSGKIYFDCKSYELAAQNFVKALKINYKEEYLFNLACAYQKLNNYEDAIRFYSDYNEKIPNNKQSYNNIGYCYSKLDKNREAVRNFEKALEIDSTYVDAYLNRGMVAYNLKNYPRAIEAFSKGLEFDADNKYLLNNRGVAFFKVEKYLEAQNDFDKLINLFPDDGVAYINRGNVMERMRKNEAACEDWQRASLLGIKESDELLKTCD